MGFDGSDWMGEAARETLRELRPGEKERLRRRLASLQSAMKPMRLAASGEEPLFGPELELESKPGGRREL